LTKSIFVCFRFSWRLQSWSLWIYITFFIICIDMFNLSIFTYCLSESTEWLILFLFNLMTLFFFYLLLLLGCSRIWTSCYVSTRSYSWWCQSIDSFWSVYYFYLNSSGTWSVYNSPMRWCIYKSWFTNSDIWCTTTGGLFRIVFNQNNLDCLYIDFNKRFRNSRCWCSSVFSSIWSSYIYYQCWRCTKKYTIISCNEFT
jgi:hypothetical protein